ncbi:porimin [Tiliqua scincoides]|uniref:porimin n=1 Tax=Tiliqua scincoides TaxID=71010 RepID=UPI003461F1B1
MAPSCPAGAPPPLPSRAQPAPALRTDGEAEPGAAGEGPRCSSLPSPGRATMRRALLLLLALLCVSGQPQAGNTTVNSPETSSPHLSNSTTSPSKAKNTTTVAPQNATSSRPIPTVTNSTNTTTPSAVPTNKTTNATTAKPTTLSAVTKATSKTVPSPSATATPKATAAQIKASGFSVGSFIGGIVLTLVVLAIGYIGCRTYHAKRGVQYRTIDEHDAII